MAVVAIICDFEIGHLFPSLGLADELREDGHEIVFLIIKDMEGLVQDAGFSSVIIFSEFYPPGAIKEFDELRQSGKSPKIKPHLISLLNGSLDHVFKKIKPDLLLIDYSLAFEALIIHYRYSINQVFFCTFLREENITPKVVCVGYFMNLEGDVPSAVLAFIQEKKRGVGLEKLDDILFPIDNMLEIILCPKEFEMPGKEYRDQRVCHIGPCIADIIKFDRSDFVIPNFKRNIFFTFGSQGSLYPEKFIKVINELFCLFRSASFSDFHLTIALGDVIKGEGFTNIPPNVTMKKWLHQNKIIELSSLVITHGGLGTIKESLYFGVPMIVIPMMRDQPGNALRIEQHNLGKSIEIDSLTARMLEEAIFYVLTNEGIKNSVEKMKCVFREKEQQKLGSQMINKQLGFFSV